MSSKLRHILPILLLAVPLSLTFGQTLEEGPAYEKIQQLRRIKLIEALDLDEETAIRFFARENEFRKAHKEVEKNRDQAIGALNDLISQNVSDEALLKGVENVQKIDVEFQNKRYEFVRGLSDILTVKQIAQFVVFDQKFMKEVRSIIDSIRERRPPPRRR